MGKMMDIVKVFMKELILPLDLSYNKNKQHIMHFKKIGRRRYKQRRK
jgi:hypothetical protein